MGNYDLLVGLNGDQLNLITNKVYASQSQLFSGNNSGNWNSVQYTVNWSIGAAPTVVLRAPTAAEWSSAIKKDGSVAAPQGSGAFIVNLSNVNVQISAAGQTPSLANNAAIICTVVSQNGALSFNPLAVVVNLSQQTPFDQFVLSSILIPGLLNAVGGSVVGIQLPQLAPAGIAFTPPAVDVSGGYLVAAFNMTSSGAPSVPQDQPPGDPFFALLSPGLVQAAVSFEVQTNVQGQQFNKSGSQGAGGFNANYSVWGKIDGLAVSTTADPLTLSAAASIEMSASAGIDLGFLGPIVSVPGTVIHALDPTHW
jgi:hypothetical protein